MHTPTPLRVIAALLLVFGFSGCANYPMEPLREGLVPESAMTAWIAQPDWWTGYADPQLDSVVSQALERNVNLARAAVNVNRALYQARRLGADLLPSFSGGGQGSFSTSLKTGTTGESYQGNVGLNYELDLWQRLANTASAAEWEQQATVQDRESTRLALINSVIDTWFELRYVREALDVTRTSMDRYTRLLDIVRAKYDLGKTTAVEPLQAEQYLLAARNNLLSLQARRNTAEQLLRDLLNARPGETFAVTGSSLLLTPTVPVDLDVPVAALSLRPDIKAAEARLQGAFKTLQATENSWYPGVSIGSTLSTSATNVDRFFNLPVLGNMVQLTFPFLDWNRVRWNIRISEADFELSRLGFTETVTTALNEVAAARFAWENASASFDNTLQKHEKDVRIGEYYQTRYDLGAAELKDYLDALNTADTSMLSALESRYQSIRYENQVYKAMGVRWTRRQ